MQYLREMSIAKKDIARGVRLVALREARELTQVEVGRELGVDSGTVSRWERGEPISPKNLDKLAAFYDVDADFIVSGSPTEAVETYAAFAEYKAWLDKHPDELASLPDGALENIKTFRLTISNAYEPNLQSYMVLHSFMVGLKRKKRSRS